MTWFHKYLQSIKWIYVRSLVVFGLCFQNMEDSPSAPEYSSLSCCHDFFTILLDFDKAQFHIIN